MEGCGRKVFNTPFRHYPGTHLSLPAKFKLAVRFGRLLSIFAAFVRDLPGQAIDVVGKPGNGKTPEPYGPSSPVSKPI
jgi:hypothetical protein